MVQIRTTPSDRCGSAGGNSPGVQRPPRGPTRACSTTPHRGNGSVLLLIALIGWNAVVKAQDIVTEPSNFLETKDLTQIVFPEDTTALTSPTTTTTTTTAAPSASDKPRLSIHKCCPDREVFSHTHRRCVPNDVITFSVPIFAVDENGFYPESNFTRDQVDIQSGFITCVDSFVLNEDPNVEAQYQLMILESGELWVPEYSIVYPLDKYCLENFVADADDPNSPHILGGAVCNVNAPQSFNPDKIPVRKCCAYDLIYHTSNNSCELRSDVTSKPWVAPIMDEFGNIANVNVRLQPYDETHEIFTSFQSCQSGYLGETFNSSTSHFFVTKETGDLYVTELGRLVPPMHYCIEDFIVSYDSYFHITSVAYVCMREEEASVVKPLTTEGCQGEVCLSKCCRMGEVFDLSLKICVPSSTSAFVPEFLFPNGSILAHTAQVDYTFGFPDCKPQLTNDHEIVEILPSGSIYYYAYDSDECNPLQRHKVDRESYCVDQFMYPDGRTRIGGGICHKEAWEVLGTSQEFYSRGTLHYVYSFFLAISNIFILISIIIYLTVPDQTQLGLNKNAKLAHSMLGRILLCFLFFLFFSNLFLIIIKLASEEINMASSEACMALGVCTYVFFMATFFWLNVLCFELWWKCARQEGTSGRRWLWYQLYAGTGPLLFGGVALIMEFIPGISNCYIKPKFGVNSCFFSVTRTHNNGAKWAYFFGPVACLLVADIVFFILTVRSLLVTVQQSHKGTVQKQTKQRLTLCFKLFLVMGITWMTEIISFQLGPRTVWYIADVFNCLQGFIIFLIFILKPKIMSAVRESLCGRCLSCGSQSSTKTSGMGNSSATFTQSVMTTVDSVSRTHDYSSSRSPSPCNFMHLHPNDTRGSVNNKNINNNNNSNATSSSTTTSQYLKPNASPARSTLSRSSTRSPSPNGSASPSSDRSSSTRVTSMSSVAENPV